MPQFKYCKESYLLKVSPLPIRQGRFLAFLRMIHDGKTSFLPGQPIVAAQRAEASGSLCVSAGLGGLDRVVGMMGRGVNRIELEGTGAGVDDIVPCPGGDKDRTTV